MSYNDKFKDATGYERGGRQSLGRKSSDQWEECGEQNLLHTKQDDGWSPQHDIFDRVENQSGSALDYQRGPLGMDNGNWSPRGLPRGGEPRYAPKGDATTRSPKAATPTGKYRKIGGPGQRSGS
jgi:hypothetical protein